jgi:hypothetical protein
VSRRINWRASEDLYYRLVTIGGGGVVRPAIVARVSTAMIASESFFITESSVPRTAWRYYSARM